MNEYLTPLEFVLECYPEEYDDYLTLTGQLIGDDSADSFLDELEESVDDVMW